MAAGVYLPLTAVLGGLLFVQPEGYEEAKRDVIRLSADVDALVQQQGYITCDPLDPLEGGPMEPHPLHCSLLVIPAQVRYLRFRGHLVMLLVAVFRCAHPICWVLGLHGFGNMILALDGAAQLFADLTFRCQTVVGKTFQDKFVSQPKPSMHV